LRAAVQKSSERRGRTSGAASDAAGASRSGSSSASSSSSASLRDADTTPIDDRVSRSLTGKRPQSAANAAQPESSTRGGGKQTKSTTHAPTTSLPVLPRPGVPASTTGTGVSSRPSRPQSADARRELRKATRSRRRYERAEARRFTQRSRRRRMAWLITGASVAALVLVVLLAAYSPLLAVRSLAVEGTSRLDAATVSTALDDQLGRPLALVDYGAIERQLAQFPLIESYSVEARPPDTLAIRIVERRPVALIQTDAGFNLIDAAGVTVQQSPDRIPGFPVLDLTGTEIGSSGFTAAAAVLMSLPDALLAQVDRISGTTPDSVTLVFTGAGQRVVWGSAEDSELKARILERLIATQDPSLPVEYDVSSPQSPVIR
jgi:cell division protein FtsQ